MKPGYNLKTDSKNWFFAVGGYSFWGKVKLVVEKDNVGGKGFLLDFITSVPTLNRINSIGYRYCPR